jgi:hypothetical protein
VEHEYYFDANRYADFVVRLTPDRNDTDWDESLWWGVEVENDFNSATEGIGQAAMYAGLLTIEKGHDNVSPVVIFPDDAIEQPELAAMRRHAQIVIFPTGYASNETTESSESF